MPVLPRVPRLTPEMRRLAVIAAPALLAGGVVQVNLLVGRQVGSFFDGAVAWLSYADRLYQLPLGVVGIAIGVVLLPDLSRRLKAGDGRGGRDAINRATEFTLALTPAGGRGADGDPGADRRGAVPARRLRRRRHASDRARRRGLWRGLPAFVMQKVISPLYYAREDTRCPFRFAVMRDRQRRGGARARAVHRLHRRGARHHRRRLGGCSGSSGAAPAPWASPPPDARLRRAAAPGSRCLRADGRRCSSARLLAAALADPLHAMALARWCSAHGELTSRHSPPAAAPADPPRRLRRGCARLGPGNSMPPWVPPSFGWRRAPEGSTPAVRARATAITRAVPAE